MAKSVGNMLKQAQKLQSKIFKLQEELGDKTVETTVGGGMIKAVGNGKQELVSLEIDPEVVDPNDVAMLEDLVVAAVNEVLKKAKDMVSEEMTKLAGGLNLPPGLL